MRKLAFALALGLAGAANAQLAEKTATGEFDVKVAPVSAKDENVMRLSIDKVLRGGITGTSTGQMMASGGADEKSGAYVAIETVTGTLGGRKGSFALAHRGTMTPTSQQMSIIVVPGSGTGELSGIDGTFDIRIEKGGKHFYTFRYTLPGR